MKKSLSLVVSSALVFSLFSSVAFAADATTTSTAPTTQEMMKDLGFSGTDHDYLDRASAAVSILKGLGIEVDNTATLSFTDVNASDAWAPYIATAAKLGIVHGVDATHFQPFEKVSQQDYAIMLTLGYAAKTGQKVDTTATTDVNAADYAKPYIKAAIDLGLLDASTDWSATAGYDWMVKGAYNAKVASSKPAEPAKVSVSSAKATGVQKVEVTLDKAVDTTKASFTLKVNGSSVSIDKTDWSDDKKVATLELASKIRAGEYTVTLGGLDASAMDQTTATFTAQDEAIKSIDFVSASDTLPASKSATILLKATNQYGEIASVGASNFTAYVSGNPQNVKVNSDGYLELSGLDFTGGSYIAGSSVIPVTVYENTSRVTVSKNFKLGTAPFPSKVEIGQVTYSNNADALTNAGDIATIGMKVYDQYGNQMTKSQFTGGTADVSISTLNAVISPYDQYLSYVNDVSDDHFDNNDNIVTQVKLSHKEDKNADFTVTVYAGSGSATATVHVGAGAVPVKVAFGDFTDHVAEGDAGDYYMPINAYDVNGKLLSAQDIVDNKDRFTFSATNTAADPVLVLYGDHKGQLKFQLKSGVKARSAIYFTAVIATVNANSYDQKSIPVEAQRYPDHIVIDDTPSQEFIAGATDTISYQIKDQYNSDISSDVGTVSDINGNQYDYRYVISATGDTNSGITVTDSNGTPHQIQVDGTPADATHVYASSAYADVNGTFNIATDGSKTGSLTLKAVVQRKNHADADVDASYSDVSPTVSFNLKEIKSDSDLTYSLDAIPTLYAVEDQLGNYYHGSDEANQVKTAHSWFVHKVTVSAKDSAGNSVALPSDYVRNVVSSNRSIVDYQYAANDSTTGDGSIVHGYLLGDKAGTATVTASVYTNKGTNVVLTQDVTVKADPIVVDSITTDNSAVTLDTTIASGNTYPDVFHQFNDLKVKDQYGNEYDGKDGEITKFNELLGITYAVTSIDGTGTVTIDADGQISNIDSGVNSFVITATAPNGKSVQVVVNK